MVGKPTFKKFISSSIKFYIRKKLRKMKPITAIRKAAMKMEICLEINSVTMTQMKTKNKRKRMKVIED